MQMDKVTILNQNHSQNEFNMASHAFHQKKDRYICIPVFTEQYSNELSSVLGS